MSIIVTDTYETAHELNVTVEVYSYAAEAYRAKHGTDSHDDVFADDDIPEQPERQLHARTCPDCGTVYHELIGACPVVNCPTNLEETEEASMQVDMAQHHEMLLIDLLNSYASDGITELNPAQATVFRRILTRCDIPALRRTTTARATTYSTDLEEEDGMAHVQLTLRADGTGCVHAVRPEHHTDLGIEWSQDDALDEVVTPYAELKQEHWRREGARLIERAHAIRGGM